MVVPLSFKGVSAAHAHSVLRSRRVPVHRRVPHGFRAERPPALARRGDDAFVLRSAFCVLRSAFCVLRSAFCVLRSAFRVLRSAFCVLRSAFSLIPEP
jgi:hypothetical protein